MARFADAVTVADDPDAVAAARGWVGRWVAASRELLAQDEPTSASLSDLDAYAERASSRATSSPLRAPVTRRMLVEAVWNATWPHDRLVVGASRLIRELDRVAPGKKIPVHANRGLAGIDGTIATATGIALASQRDAAPPGITRVLLGDLVAAARRRARCSAARASRGRACSSSSATTTAARSSTGSRSRGRRMPALVDRVLLTPQQVDLEALAAAYGWEYRRVENRGELDEALTASGTARHRGGPPGALMPVHRRPSSDAQVRRASRPT